MSTMQTSEPQFRVLLIDDDQDMHDLISCMLASQNIELISVLDDQRVIELVRQKRPDLILLDYELPSINGLEILRELRSNADLESIPVVFITANDSHKILTAAFQAGAADYIRKPLCASELRARIESVLGRRHILGQLEQLAHFDPLTRLFNRTSIRNRIQAAINESGNGHCALLFLDFDRFKLVNDSLGHDIGDQLLQQIAERLIGALRHDDAASYLPKRNSTARLGGDEFVVLLEGLQHADDALRVADRLLKSLEAPYSLSGHQVWSTASIGVVNHIQPTSTPDDILRDADTAMYQAKSEGKGRYVLFNQAMHDDAEQRLQLENELRSAITNSELFVEYQPIVSLESGRTIGAEALVRWNHPQRGPMMPAAFLPIAEESGLIVRLGTWVLDQACRDFAGWQQSLGARAPTSIHVNVARKQLLRGFVDEVRETLDRYAVAPHCLHLEVAENEIMQNPDVTRPTLSALRQIGIKIDMDDFGTGHSSLACLQELPIDALKIDRTFVANMERTRSFAALVHAVTTLGQNLGLTVVAEGIETADQLAMLQSMECGYGQGYFFAAAMSADRFNMYLNSASLQRP